MDVLLQEPRKNIDLWQSFVFIPQGQPAQQGPTGTGGNVMGAAGNVPPQLAHRSQARFSSGSQMQQQQQQARGWQAPTPGKQRNRGKFRTTADKKPICFDYNSQKGCVNPCPKGFVHACTQCGKAGHMQLDTCCENFHA